MKCRKCGRSFAEELGNCPYCVTLAKKPGRSLGQDFISRLFAGDIPHGTPFSERYDIEELVGRGGMGIVYRAVDKVLNEKVAIKILNPLFSSDKDVNERFKQEIKLARKINHENVISIYDMGEVDGIRYISMEYIQGKDLKEVIRAEGGALPLNFAIIIIRQIVAALKVAHDLGIIHRDIKPQNILIQRNGQVKILDFGIARLANSDELTRTGSLLGSPVYMSPEQASGKDTDHRSDIYSLGVIMFEIFSGRIPFLADTPIATALKHVNEEPPRPTSINPNVPIWVENIILKAMEKRPEDRFNSVLEIIDPVHGLHSDRLSDSDIVICPFCGKRNPHTNSSCSNCQSFLGRESQSSSSLDIRDDYELQQEMERLLDAAEQAITLEKYEQAKDRLERVLIIDENNERARNTLIEVEAKLTLGRRIDLYHQNALISFQDKKYDDAITLWERILTLDPERKDVKGYLKRARENLDIYDRIKGYINKGLQEYNSNKYREAITFWEKVIEIDPRNVDAAFYISKTQILLNSEEKRQKLRQQAEKYAHQKNYEKAIDQYRQLLNMDQGNLSLSLIIEELEDAKKVQDLLQEGLQHYKVHEYEQAIDFWNKIFSLDPDNKDAQNYIIQARAKINESATVKEIFRIGLLHYRDKKWKQAISRFEDVKKFVGPYQKDAIHYVKMAEIQVEKEKKIDMLLQAGLDLYHQEHQDPASKIWGASAAIKQWEKALTIEPQNRQALEYIAKAKLIIKRSKLIVESRNVASTQSVTVKQPYSQPEEKEIPKIEKKSIKTPFKKVQTNPWLRDHIVGSIFGAAVGDALGVGTSWMAAEDDYASETTNYQKNQVGRFRNIEPGTLSGEMELTLTAAQGVFNEGHFHPKRIIETMVQKSVQLAVPTERSTELLILKLKKGIPWKQAVLKDEDDFAPLYRSILISVLTCFDQDELINRSRSLTLLTHKNKKVISVCIAASYAIYYILDFKNRELNAKGKTIGMQGDGIVWDNADFLKFLSAKVESYDKNVADQMLELIIYAGMPRDRFFDTVGISEKVEETFLSALYCFLKSREDFSASVKLAVNARGTMKHITGNRHGIAGLTGFFSGAYNGFVAIPAEWINGLILNDYVFDVATDLYEKSY